MSASCVISLRFNQDQGCFTCCTEASCMIYNVDPLEEKYDLDFSTHGSYAICEMLHRSQLCALVPSKRNKKYENNIVLIYDYNTEEIVSRDTVCAGPVTGLRMRKDRFSMFRMFSSYADSQWAMATFQIPKESPCICTFNELKKSITAICKDGTYHKFTFNDDGDCSREEYKKFLDVFQYEEFYPFR